jgi:SagB-type dehydrogenase family enzyme
MKLPEHRFKEGKSVEDLLKLRKTVRTFSDREVDLPLVSQLLWALQGVTYVEKLPDKKRAFHRTYPSAGKTYPLEAYLAFSGGLYRYEPRRHELQLMNDEDVRGKLAEAAAAPLNKEAIRVAPLTIILAADNNRALKATPLLENAVRFVHLEAGHATQNLILQAASLGLGVCTITSYNVAMVYETLKLPREHRPIYLLPVGFPKDGQ